MASKLGSLTLDLIARVGNFTGPIQQAERQAQSSFGNMRQHVNNYGAVVVAGAAAAGAGIFAMANEFSNAASELERLAFISKTSTQEFQGYAVGAQTMGIEMETLAGQFKDFNEKLGEFITIGSGGALDFFEQIAIKTEGSAEGAKKLALEMQNLSGPKALQLFMDKMEEAGATQQQMSFYLESMAGDTTNLIPLLRNGGEGFKFWADAAERAGVIIDESGIQKAAELRVQMRLLDLQVEGAKNQFIQGLMPALVAVGNGMTSGAHQTNLMSEAGQTVGEVFKGVAAVGMGVYAVVKSLSNAIAGLAFDALNAKRIVDSAAEQGNWFDNLPGVKFAKTAIFGATMMSAPNSGVAMAAEDNRKLVDDTATSIRNIYSNAVNESVSAMAQLESGQAGVSKGLDDWTKKQNEASKAVSASAAATAQNAKTQQDLNQAIELGQRLVYEYGDEIYRINADYADDLKDIIGADLKHEDKQKYLALAKSQAEARKKAYTLELDSELNQFRRTEEEKLRDEINVAAHRLDAQRGLNDDELKLRKAFLREKFQAELSYIQDEKLARAQSAESAWGGTFSDITGQSDQFSVEQERFGRYGESQELFDAQMALAETAEQREAIWQAHHDRMSLIESDYYEAKAELEQTQHAATLNMYGDLLSQASSVWGDMTQMVKDSEGEQSGAYKAMFLAQQMFAMGSALVSTHLAAAQVLADPTALTLAQKSMYSSLILGMGYANVGLIAGQTIAGMAHDGIDNVPKEGTWLLDRGERVVDARTNGDLKNFLSNRQEGLKVIVNTLPGTTANVSRGSDGTLTIDMVRKDIVNQINDQSSPVSKALKSSHGTRAVR